MLSFLLLYYAISTTVGFMSTSGFNCGFRLNKGNETQSKTLHMYTVHGLEICSATINREAWLRECQSDKSRLI